MTDLELINKMRSELTNCQIGLHNVSSEKFQNIITFLPEHRDVFRFTSAEVTDEAIAKQILISGLRVLDKPFGLRSTVTFLKKLTDTSLEYNYNATDNITTNVIVAIPKYIPYEGEEYYIGDLRSYQNIGNMLLFNPVLLPEFIYGYYTRRVASNISNGHITFDYDGHLTFNENQIHFTKQTLLEQKETIKKLIELRKHSLKYMRLANNTQLLPLIFTPSYARTAIMETRKQKQELLLKKA